MGWDYYGDKEPFEESVQVRCFFWTFVTSLFFKVGG
jgi:hypothetical protein